MKPLLATICFAGLWALTEASPYTLGVGLGALLGVLTFYRPGLNRCLSGGIHFAYQLLPEAHGTDDYRPDSCLMNAPTVPPADMIDR